MSDVIPGPDDDQIIPIDLDNDGYVADPPKLPGLVVAREEADDVFTHVARDLLDQALRCVRSFGSFQMALSGGHTPFPLYERLMTDPLYRGFPWAKTHLWIVDDVIEQQMHVGAFARRAHLEHLRACLHRGAIERGEVLRLQLSTCNF